jgi:hypothetical protein
MSSAQPVETNNPRKYQLFIDGKWVDAESGQDIHHAESRDRRNARRSRRS